MKMYISHFSDSSLTYRISVIALAAISISHPLRKELCLSHPEIWMPS